MGHHVHPFRLRNGLIIANSICNLIGVLIPQLITGVWTPLPGGALAEVSILNRYFTPLAFLLGTIATLLYEIPLRRFLWKHNSRGRLHQDRFNIRLRRRCLNEPFFLIMLDFCLWAASAVFFSYFIWRSGANRLVVQYMIGLNMNIGLMTCILAFFTFEYILQNWLIPALFRNERLSAIPGVIRIRIGTRLVAMLLACSILPFISTIGTLRQMKAAAATSPVVVGQFGTAIAVNSLIFVCIGIWVTILVKRNLTRPLKHMMEVLNEVRRGNFDQKVPVTSNDEIGYTAEVINQMTEGLKERDMIKEMFGRYVAHEVRDEILSGRIPLDGEMKEVTVLFCDLRDFTPLTESLPPKEVVAIINRYFRKMEEIIQKHNGLVLQFLGDEIEAVFGAPVSRPDHASLAVAAALEMSRRVTQVNAELQVGGYAPLRHGIGIHSGEAVAANIGSPNRLSYALVGDTVNIASRLQGLNKVYGTEVIVSGATKERLNGAFALSPLPETTLKGITRPIKLYTIAGCGGPSGNGEGRPPSS